MEIPRVAVVATHNRPAELARLLDAIAPQCDAVVVVDNASDPPVKPMTFWPERIADDTPRVARVHVIRDEEQPPNLSRLWNIGLDHARSIVNPLAGEPYDVAVLNDDAVPPPGWWDAMSGAMRIHGADAASSDPWGALPRGVVNVLDGTAPMTVSTRLTGWAMMLRGEWEGARFDERLRWWAQDDLISLRAREAGGLAHVGGYPVQNTKANTTTVGVLADQATKDMQTFVEITGRRPW